MYSLQLKTAPTEQPATLAEAKKQVEVAAGMTYHDAHLTRLIKAATEEVERLANRAILSQTLVLRLDRFPADRGRIPLPRPPLKSVTHVKYYDTTGVLRTLSATAYKVLTHQEPGQLALKYNQTWPSVYAEAEAVEIEYLAGYATNAAALQARHEELKAAILLLVQSAWLREHGMQSGKDLHQLRAHQLCEGWRCGDDFLEYS